MPENTNLPVKVNNNLIDKFRKSQPQIIEKAKRVGKVALWTGVTGVGVMTLPFSVPLSIGAISVGTFRAYFNAISRNSSDIMFSSRKIIGKDSIKISQDFLRPDVASKMIGYNSYEIGSMMALQTLVGLERYKRELEGTQKEIGNKDGINIYSKKFELFTHGINIKNMELLEKLGYIKIDSSEPRMKKNLFGKEGFGNFKDVLNIAKMTIKGDKEGLEKEKRVMHNIEFRLTDKHIDFEELYNLCNSEEKTPAKRLGAIFNKKRGLLAKRPIDIQYDKYGMPRIKYHVKQSFAEKIEQQTPIKQSIQTENLKDRINYRDKFTDEKQQEIADKFMQNENIKNEIENEKEY